MDRSTKLVAGDGGLGAPNNCIHTDDGYWIGEVYPVASNVNCGDDMIDVDAASVTARLVACWNACRGINPEAMAEAAEALRNIESEYLDTYEGKDDPIPTWAREALAKLHGGTT